MSFVILLSHTPRSQKLFIARTFMQLSATTNIGARVLFLDATLHALVLTGTMQNTVHCAFSFEANLQHDHSNDESDNEAPIAECIAYKLGIKKG